MSLTLVDRVMWFLLVREGHGSPRKMWAEMSDEDRAQRRNEAEELVDLIERFAAEDKREGLDTR